MNDSIIFTFNHQNYSRWLTVYHDKLLKLKNSNPDIYEKFKNGYFSLKPTSKPFSGIPIDLTLEQTINADAGMMMQHFFKMFLKTHAW